MGLTSLALVFLLGAAVAVLLSAVLLAWRRLAGRGPRRIAARAAALVALQAAVLSLIFVVANRSLEFYSSWSDLMGAETGGGTLLAVRGGGVSSADAVTVLARSAVPVPGVASAGGRLESVRIHGELSGLTVLGHLYLPAGYGRAAAAGRRYPVIVVITNQEASLTSPYGARRLAGAAAAQTAAGRLAPVIMLVLPAWLGRSDQGCLNIPGGTQGQTFFAQDVPQELQTAFRASTSPGSWALLGDQSGGYCALQLAMDDSTVFSVAVAPPGRYTQAPGPAVAAASPQLRHQDNLLWQLRHMPLQPVSVLFAGPGPVAGFGPAQVFAGLARSPMRAAAADLGTGRWPLAPVLDWVNAAMKAPAASEVQRTPAG
jgi:hypothetical protein